MVNPIKWGELQISIGATQGNRIQLVKDFTGRIGYQAIMVATPSGMAPIIADPGCPNSRGYLLDMDTWVCGSVGELVHVIDDDGLKLRRDPDADGWMFELKSRGCFACDNPGRNVVIAL